MILHRLNHRSGLFLLVLTASVGVASCHKEPHNPADLGSAFDLGISGPGTFNFSPVKISDIAYATPLGNLNPPGHTLPSDHIYFYLVNPDHRTPGDMDTMKEVYAPGSGIVTWIYGPTPPGVDSKIQIKMTNTFQYYLDHVVLGPQIKVGSSIKAGQVVGTSSPQSYAVDLASTATAIAGSRLHPIAGSAPLQWRSCLYGSGGLRPAQDL